MKRFQRLAQLLLLVGFLLTSSIPVLSLEETCDTATGLGLPVVGNQWIQTQSFANYLSTYGGKTYNGYHGGEDWGVSEGSGGMPVYAVGPGRIAKISSFTGLGQLVAIEHTGSFTIPERSETVNSLSYYYPTETVSKFYSIYLHINATQGLTVGQCVNRALQIGTMANISAPHLHFEIRHPNQQPSGHWSLVGDSTNWAKFSGGGYNGYYINPQSMVDAGLRDASQFLSVNATSAPTPPQNLRVVE